MGVWSLRSIAIAIFSPRRAKPERWKPQVPKGSDETQMKPEGFASEISTNQSRRMSPKLSPARLRLASAFQFGGRVNFNTVNVLDLQHVADRSNVEIRPVHFANLLWFVKLAYLVVLIV
jgi:hypothetical protein